MGDLGSVGIVSVVHVDAPLVLQVKRDGLNIVLLAEVGTTLAKPVKREVAAGLLGTPRCSEMNMH